MDTEISFSVRLASAGTTPIYFDDGTYFGYINMDRRGTELHDRIYHQLAAQGWEILHSKAHGSLSHGGYLRVKIRW